MVPHSIFGGSGACPPEKNLNNRCSEIDSEAFWRCFKPQRRGASVVTFVEEAGRIHRLLDCLRSQSNVLVSHHLNRHSTPVAFGLLLDTKLYDSRDPYLLAMPHVRHVWMSNNATYLLPYTCM